MSHDRQCLVCDNNNPEVDKVISRMHKRKSPGPDGLVVGLLKIVGKL